MNGIAATGDYRVEDKTTVVSISTGEETEEFLPAPGQDKTPTLVSQAEAKGWRAGVFDFGKAGAPNVAHFNPSLVERPDGLWLMVRRAEFNEGFGNFGLNSIVAFKLKDEQSLMPTFGKRLQFSNSQPDEQFEDPRGVFHNGHTWLSVCNFIWYNTGEWTGAHQTLAVFTTDTADTEQDWLCIRRYAPEVGGNSPHVNEQGKLHEKNWCWWFHEDRLTVLYHSNPWRVAQFGEKWENATPYEHEFGATWNYGDIRGGTPPVLVNGLYWTFFHSSVPWISRFRRYHMGAVAFEAEPPFTPRLITAEPLLTGNQTDRWKPSKPLVVFPCGSRIKHDKWLITYGINDLASGWVEIPHDDIIRLARPITSPKKQEPLPDTLSIAPPYRDYMINEMQRATDLNGEAALPIGATRHRETPAAGSSAPPVQSESFKRDTPWVNRSESEKEVRTLCEALALFCKAPAYKSRVRQALREAKIIK
jgi:predicted GH43/DUF377 family glycosyl hydrolase